MIHSSTTDQSSFNFHPSHSFIRNEFVETIVYLFIYILCPILYDSYDNSCSLYKESPQDPLL